MDETDDKASEQSGSRALIERELERQGVTVKEWREGEDGLEAVLNGHWGVIEEDEDQGLYEGDEGRVTACVVGSQKYGNQRVCFSFAPDGYDGGSEVRLFDNVEPL